MKTLGATLALCTLACSVCTADLYIFWRSGHGIDDPARRGTARDLPVGSLVQLVWTPSGAIVPPDPHDAATPRGDNVLIDASLTDTPGTYFRMLGPLPNILAAGFVFTRVFNSGTPGPSDYYDETELTNLAEPESFYVSDMAPGGLHTLGKRLRGPCFIDVKANGSDGPVYLDCCLPIHLTIELAACRWAGAPVDWWLVMAVPEYWAPPLWHYELLPRPSPQPEDYWWPDLVPTFQGPLVDIPPTSLGLIDAFPPGHYRYTFAVDFRMNGVVDFDVLFMDTVDVFLLP